MRVFFHYRSFGQGNWTNIELEVAQIPAVGEYVTLQPNSPWYKVQIVIHLAFEDRNLDGEVFAVETDHMEEQHQAMPDFP